MGIDQILDMGRTTVNLIGNCIATVVVAKWENEFNYTKMEEFNKQFTNKTNKKSDGIEKITYTESLIEEHSNIGFNESDELTSK